MQTHACGQNTQHLSALFQPSGVPEHLPLKLKYILFFEALLNILIKMLTIFFGGGTLDKRS